MSMGRVSVLSSIRKGVGKGVKHEHGKGEREPRRVNIFCAWPTLEDVRFKFALAELTVERSDAFACTTVSRS
jgi:hypothetical protein